MKILRRIFIWTFVICIVSFVGLSVFIGLNGKRMAEAHLTKAFGRSTKIGNVSFLAPLGMRLNRLEIQDALHIKTADVQFGIPIILNKQFVITKVRVTEPVVIIQRTKDKQIVLGQESRESRGVSGEVDPDRKREISARSATHQNEKESVPGPVEGVFVNYLEIGNGKVQFSDFASGKEFQLTVEGLDLKAHSIGYPLQPVDATFDLTAKIFSPHIPFSGSRVEAKGWVNVIERNMEGSLKVIDPDGRLGLSADLKSLHNDMTVEGSINMGRLASGTDSQGSGGSSLEGFVLGALQSTGLEMSMDFSFKTKMDDFHIASLSVRGDVGYEGMKQDAGDGTKIDFRKIGEQFEAFGKQFYKKNIEPLSQ